MLDTDVHDLSAEQLVQEVIKLRTAIREHRDSTGHELCWHHPKLWNLLPEKTDPNVAVPPWPEFMKGCIRYRTSLDPSTSFLHFVPAGMRSGRERFIFF